MIENYRFYIKRGEEDEAQVTRTEFISTAKGLGFGHDDDPEDKIPVPGFDAVGLAGRIERFDPNSEPEWPGRPQEIPQPAANSVVAEPAGPRRVSIVRLQATPMRPTVYRLPKGTVVRDVVSMPNDPSFGFNEPMIGITIITSTDQSLELDPFIFVMLKDPGMLDDVEEEIVNALKDQSAEWVSLKGGRMEYLGTTAVHDIITHADVSEVELQAPIISTEGTIIHACRFIPDEL